MTDHSPEVAAAIAALVEAGVTPDQYRAARLAAGGPLPTWDEMSDLDKGAALLHEHKRESEGAEYAVENYPCRYIESPRLLALDQVDACNHAAKVCGDDVFGRLGVDEYRRLYDLALDYED